jgi:hypothetical protein
MKKGIIVCITIALVAHFKASAQDVKWTKAENWRLYLIIDKKDYSTSVDSLGKFKSISLDQDTMRMYVTSAEEWPKEKYSMWMGKYLSTCEIGGIMRKIDISMYGGFFYDENTKKYFQIPPALRGSWLNYLNESYSQK